MRVADTPRQRVIVSSDVFVGFGVVFVGFSLRLSVRAVRQCAFSCSVVVLFSLMFPVELAQCDFWLIDLVSNMCFWNER